MKYRIVEMMDKSYRIQGNFLFFWLYIESCISFPSIEAAAEHITTLQNIDDATRINRVVAQASIKNGRRHWKGVKQ